MNTENDIAELSKWLNEEPNRPIDRAALARVLASRQAGQTNGGYSPLSPAEIEALTCMQAGAPWNCIDELAELFALYERLRADGRRPFDPASLTEADSEAFWERGVFPAQREPEPVTLNSGAMHFLDPAVAKALGARPMTAAEMRHAAAHDSSCVGAFARARP
jgi:hypothetical protein